VSNFFFAQEDSIKIFSFEEFCTTVRDHHPVAKQARLKIETGYSQVKSAKGAFDPAVSSDIGQKYFSGDQYYSLINAGLQIPTWFGIELYSGYDQNQGIYLNPQSTTPQNGLFYAGISIPLGQDLFIDKRMYALQQAKIYQQSSLAESRLVLNDLIYESSSFYWQWFLAFHKVQIYSQAYLAAQERANGIRQSALIGDRAMVDTLEVGIQVQNRLFGLNQAKLELEKAKANLSLFLWYDGNVPLELTSNVNPINWFALNDSQFDRIEPALADSLINQHPLMSVYAYKADLLSLDKRYKAEQIKPTLNLKYNAITENTGSDVLTNYSSQNYTWGIEFSTPLFLREARADLTLTKIAQQDMQYEINSQRQKLLADYNYALAEWQIIADQIKLFRTTTLHYQVLLQSEQTMFLNGESSLFLVNSREMDYINAQIKLVELIAKNQLSSIRIQYSLGNLN